jgi:hypothetical protein
MWEPQPLTTLRASKTCRGENFTFTLPNPSSRITAMGVDSGSNRNEYQESSCGKGLPARKADNLAAICEPIF